MATLRDIRKRLKAIQSTKKITAAMKMVAAAKMRKVQDRMLNFRPYASRMGTVLTDLAKVAEREIHPLLALRLKKKVEVVVITSDKGLCGAFNTNILKAANNYINGLKKEGIELTLNYWITHSAYINMAATYAEHRYDHIERPLLSSTGNVDGNIIDTAPRHLGSLQLGKIHSWGLIEIEVKHIGPYYLDPEHDWEYE